MNTSSLLVVVVVVLVENVQEENFVCVLVQPSLCFDPFSVLIARWWNRGGGGGDALNAKDAESGKS